jgi:hypothetical protein
MVGGIDFNKSRIRRVVDAVLALSASPAGFTASDLAQKVGGMSGQTVSDYGPRRAAYDLKKLRGKQMVRKIGARRYLPNRDGFRAMAALVLLRDKVIQPLLASTARPTARCQTEITSSVDKHYHALRAGMLDLFEELGLVA